MKRGSDRIIMKKGDIGRAVAKIARDILRANKEIGDLTLIGIRTRGVALAKRLAQKIKKLGERDLPVGIVDITLYRDDFSKGRQPLVKSTEIDFSIEDKKVILVDDVLFTGRSIRAAMDALIDFGRPRSIKLAVLIDRGHRELPIRADFIGRAIDTTTQESVQLLLEEEDGVDEVRIIKDENKR